jgi:rhodanese-related sulfurtransferase
MMSVIFVYWLSMAGLFLSYAYDKGWILANFESVDARQAMLMLEANPQRVLLDVRTEHEYQEKHLKNAINIPVQVLSDRLNELSQFKDQPILVYCRSGNRSVKASRILTQNEYTPLNIKGGIKQLIHHNAVMNH